MAGPVIDLVFRAVNPWHYIALIHIFSILSVLLCQIDSRVSLIHKQRKQTFLWKNCFAQETFKCFCPETWTLYKNISSSIQTLQANPLKHFPIESL